MARPLDELGNRVMRLAELCPEPEPGGPDWKCEETADGWTVTSYRPSLSRDEDEEGFILDLPWCQGKEFGPFIAACYRGVPAALGVINELTGRIRDAERRMALYDLAGAAQVLRSTVRDLDRSHAKAAGS